MIHSGDLGDLVASHCCVWYIDRRFALRGPTQDQLSLEKGCGFLFINPRLVSLGPSSIMRQFSHVLDINNMPTEALMGPSQLPQKNTTIPWGSSRAWACQAFSGFPGPSTPAQQPSTWDESWQPHGPRWAVRSKTKKPRAKIL